MKMSYLYHVVAFTLRYLPVLVALQSVLLSRVIRENGLISRRPSSREISHL